MPMLSTMLLIACGGMIDCAPSSVDLVDELRGLLDARPGRRPHVHPDLRRLHRREEVLAEVGHEPERHDDGREEKDHEAAGSRRAPSSASGLVARAQRLEAMLEAALELDQRVARRRRRRHARDATGWRAGSSPSSAPACATGCRSRRARRSRLRPAA